MCAGLTAHGYVVYWELWLDVISASITYRKALCSAPSAPPPTMSSFCTPPNSCLGITLLSLASPHFMATKAAASLLKSMKWMHFEDGLQVVRGSITG